MLERLGPIDRTPGISGFDNYLNKLANLDNHKIISKLVWIILRQQYDDINYLSNTILIVVISGNSTTRTGQ